MIKNSNYRDTIATIQKKNFKSYLIFTLILGISFSCSKNTEQPYVSDQEIDHTIFFSLFQNQKVYHVKVGDIVPIYYTNNSCCFSCAPNKKHLTHLKFLSEKVLVPIMKHCEGCDQMYGLFFRAESVGSDTILRKRVIPAVKCNMNLNGFESFIVHVE